MMAMKAHGGSQPVTSSSTEERAHIHGMTPTASGTNESAAPAGSLQQTPSFDSELAEIRVSMEDLPNNMQSRLCTQ